MKNHLHTKLHDGLHVTRAQQYVNGNIASITRFSKKDQSTVRVIKRCWNCGMKVTNCTIHLKAGETMEIVCPNPECGKTL